MFNKAFNDITLADIENLVFVRKEREGNSLEYKEKINNSDGGKKEFLKDISGIANSNGGFFIIGIKEDNGVPSEIIGMEKEIGGQKIDEWIDNVLISNLDEKIQYEIKVFNIEDEKKVVVLMYVPESAKKPHMITFQNKNTYFIRHNTAVTPATQSEVGGMFMFSKKNKDEFELFLKKRNLLEEEDKNFGESINSKKLYNDEMVRNSHVLLSFVPQYLNAEKIKVISTEFQEWLKDNSSNFYPNPNVSLIQMHSKRVHLNGVTFPNILPIREGETEEKYWDYIEMFDNGFLEWGISADVLRNRKKQDDPSVERLLFKLTTAVGMTWLFFNFAKKFFKKIKYYDEIFFQFSAINVFGYRLGGFSKKWLEPYSEEYSSFRIRSCEYKNFKIIQKFLVNELTDDVIKEIILNLSEQISHVFGETTIKCFDDEGNFNDEGLRYLR